MTESVTLHGSEVPSNAFPQPHRNTGGATHNQDSTTGNSLTGIIDARVNQPMLSRITTCTMIDSGHWKSLGRMWTDRG